MKIAYIIARTLLGGMLLFASISYFYMMATHKMPAPPDGDVKTYMTGMSLVNIMNIVKTIELICGLALITGFYNALAAVVIFPIMINIVLFHAYLGPKELPMMIVLLLLNLFIAYYYRDKYKPLFEAK